MLTTHCSNPITCTEQEVSRQTPEAHHDDKDADEDSHEVGEEGESVLDVVHVATVRPLDDLLCVVHHVPQEDQQPKVDLRVDKNPSRVRYSFLQPVITHMPYGTTATASTA